MKKKNQVMDFFFHFFLSEKTWSENRSPQKRFLLKKSTHLTKMLFKNANHPCF